MQLRKAFCCITAHATLLRVDMSDCYTWSFPEFVPFCSHLYYFSSFKLFSRPFAAFC